VNTLHIDIETYSSVDLTTCGVYRYVQSPDFEILMAAWSLDRGPVEIAVGEAEINRIPGLWDPTVTKIAHHAPFERNCLNVLGHTDIEDWRDTQALAAEAGLPQKLEFLAKALGTTEKDTAGTALISLFCKPYRGRRVLGSERPDKWEAFKDYCIQDVETLLEVDNHLPEWPTRNEQRVYVADQIINDRGIRIDTEMATVALAAAKENAARHTAEMIEISGISNPNSNPQLLGFLRESGLKVDNLQAETVSKLLSGDLSPVQRRVLELRQELALVASKKYASALASVCEDGRLRGMFRFFGAHTGRWAGRGVQLHNLPRAQAENPEAAILDLKMGAGADPQTLKGLVRSLFVGPFTVADYSAIEARVLAWLAGEDWVLEAFRGGRDIYVETAQRMGGLTRFQGKVAVLALGYNGGVASLRAMGATGTDNELQPLVYQWRNANSRIVRFWARLEDAFKRGGAAGRLRVIVNGSDRYIKLPSGRSIVYRNVKTVPGAKGDRITFADPKGYRTDTYGGKLTENVTQAVARDLLADALVLLEESGYAVVGHVHDEVLVEGEDLPGVVDIMCKTPEWAEDLPLSAEGFITERYKKA
jgi:DNA polymerase